MHELFRSTARRDKEDKGRRRARIYANSSFFSRLDETKESGCASRSVSSREMSLLSDLYRGTYTPTYIYSRRNFSRKHAILTSRPSDIRMEDI